LTSTAGSVPDDVTFLTTNHRGEIFGKPASW